MRELLEPAVAGAVERLYSLARRVQAARIPLVPREAIRHEFPLVSARRSAAGVHGGNRSGVTGARLDAIRRREDRPRGLARHPRRQRSITGQDDAKRVDTRQRRPVTMTLSGNVAADMENDSGGLGKVAWPPPQAPSTVTDQP